MTTRAIHLEVLPDLKTNSFMNALKRFIARTGPLTRLCTDNGGNFVGAERILREEIQTWNRERINEYLRQRSIVWKFNPPLRATLAVRRSVGFALPAEFYK